MTNLIGLPFGYWLAVATLVALVVEAALQRHRPWAMPTVMVYLTIFGWYMVEPIYTPETMISFSPESVDAAFLSVFIFLVSFRLASGLATSMFAPQVTSRLGTNDIPAERVLSASAVLWVMLLAFGVSRNDGDLIGSLFPLDARAGTNMWQRSAGADAGTFGFAVSTASYLYTLVLAIFGMMLPLQKNRWAQLLCIILIAISWPYAFLQGSRNIAIAVFVPLVFSFVLFSKFSKTIKLIFITCSTIFIEWAMREIITYRNVGFESDAVVENSGHLGLNMASELTYCIEFLKTGVMHQQWGMNFVSEIANLIPRFVWPNKPLIGIEYTVARGFGGGENDIGAFATISTGVIGQGVLDFGPYAGPVFIAVLMALWTGFLARLWAQGTIARSCLFLVGIGLTFNLGRNITLLVLWPMVFAYLMVLAFERYGARVRRSPRDAAAMVVAGER